MIVYYKDDSVKPRFHPEDAGFDLKASHDYNLQPGEIIVMPVGVSWEIANGHFAYITGRSSLNAKGIHVHQGTVDAGYRGMWRVVLQNLSDTPYHISKGDRIAQAIMMESRTHLVTFRQGVAEVNTERGTSGFGSTGR